MWPAGNFASPPPAVRRVDGPPVLSAATRGADGRPHSRRIAMDQARYLESEDGPPDRFPGGKFLKSNQCRQAAAPGSSCGRRPRWEERHDEGAVARGDASRLEGCRLRLIFAVVLALVAARRSSCCIRTRMPGPHRTSVWVPMPTKPSASGACLFDDVRRGTAVQYGLHRRVELARAARRASWPYWECKGKGYTMIWGVAYCAQHLYAERRPVYASRWKLLRADAGGHRPAEPLLPAQSSRTSSRRRLAVWVIRFGLGEFERQLVPLGGPGMHVRVVRYFDDQVTAMRWVPTRSRFTLGVEPDQRRPWVSPVFTQLLPRRPVCRTTWAFDVFTLEQQQVPPGPRAAYRRRRAQQSGMNWLASFAERPRQADCPTLNGDSAIWRLPARADDRSGVEPTTTAATNR